ncbi:cobalamin-binding protein [Candidatus Margulisiibacteriota bacterium]
MFSKAIRTAFLLLVLSIFISGAMPKINYPLQRVVSLAPNLTEMICLLDVSDKLVGVTTDCDHPELVKKIEKTGAFGSPDLEKIVMLKPELVIYSDIKDINFARKLNNLGIPALQININSLADLQHKMLLMGDLFGKKQEAKEIVTEWEKELRRYALDNKWKKKIRVYFELWRTPLITVGQSSYLHEMIVIAGGENIAGHLESPYPKPPTEYVLGADPELIVLGYTVTGNTKFPDTWQEVTALKKGLVVNDIDLDLLLRPGPRLFQGIKKLNQKINEARSVIEIDKP